MFKTKERIEKLEGKVAKLEMYCDALEKEQDEMYTTIIRGLELESSEITNMNKEFHATKARRRKAFEVLHE